LLSRQISHLPYMGIQNDSTKPGIAGVIHPDYATESITP
jgi:hypothetical protein